MDWVVGNPEKMNSLTSACLFQMMSQLQNNEKKETIRKMHREHPPWVCKRVACVKGFWLQSHLGRGGECARLLRETMVAPHRADPRQPKPRHFPHGLCGRQRVRTNCRLDSKVRESLRQSELFPASYAKPSLPALFSLYYLNLFMKVCFLL